MRFVKHICLCENKFSIKITPVCLFFRKFAPQYVVYLKNTAQCEQYSGITLNLLYNQYLSCDFVFIRPIFFANRIKNS